MIKLLLVASVACLLGVIAGYAIGWHQRVNDPALVIQAEMRETVASENFGTALSLSVLLALEKGDVDKAKSQLARQVADYQLSWAKYDGAMPKLPKLLPLIDEAVKNSPTLQAELAQPPQ